MKQDFLNYCKKTFFRPDNELLNSDQFLPMSEFESFEKSLSRPLKKTIRINTNRVSSDSFRARKGKDGWIFGATNNPNVWHIDRLDTSTALGSTEEHLSGDFYIQELSASQTVFILADWKVHSESLRILEMASSPGGKTTQLAEHYPNSFIAANEFTKDRINALLDNIERMQISSYGVSRLNGVQFRDYPEMFDLVLLDAPCSGEWIGFKAEQSLKFWNIKNVQKIARLQEKMLKAGLSALRPGGMLGYSTCTLNTIENEWVLEAALKEFWDAIEIVYQKRYWPHREIAGGFFVAKIIKKRSFDTVKQSNKTVGNVEIKTLTDSETKTLLAILPTEYLRDSYQFYRFKDSIRAVNYSGELRDLLDSWYCIKLGKHIARFEWGKILLSPQ